MESSNALQVHNSGKDVFQALHENRAKPRFYKQVDRVPTEQKRFEENCTFQPHVNEECPFVSERTLRNFANQQRRRRAPPPPPKSRPTRSPIRRRRPHKTFGDGDDEGNDENEDGMYSAEHGVEYIPPPSAGIPIFYFDPVAPPAFHEGKYTARMEVAGEPVAGPMIEEYEDVEVTDDEEGEAANPGLVAPPLPSWASGTGGPPKPTLKQAVKLVINRSKKKVEEPATAGGWQAVMGEMQKRREAILKKGSSVPKADPAVEKLKSPKKKKSGKKKKGKDFKDVMDELSFKLAKLRGEADDDSDDDDAAEEDEPSVASAAAATEQDKEVKSSKSAALAAMLKRRTIATTPTAAAAAEGEESGPGSGVTKSPLTSAARKRATFKDSVVDESATGATTASAGGDSSQEGGAGGGAAADDDVSASSGGGSSAKLRKIPSKANMMNLLSKGSGKDENGPKSTPRSKSAPNLNDMLSKRFAKQPPPTPAAAAAAASSASASSPGSSSTVAATAGGQIAGKLAVPHPEVIPAPPPVPSEGDWPPLPYLVVEPEAEPVKPKEKKKKIEKRLVKKEGPPVPGVMTIQETVQDIPAGFYMAAPVPGMVPAGQILPGGITSFELCASLKLSFERRQERIKRLLSGDTASSVGSVGSGGVSTASGPVGASLATIPTAAGAANTGTPAVASDASFSSTMPRHAYAGAVDEYKSEDGSYIGRGGVALNNDGEPILPSPEYRLKDKLAISDLPLPPDFHAAVQRIQQCNKRREELFEQRRDMELRSFLYYDKPDKSLDLSNVGSVQKKPEPTVPKGYHSHFDKHVQSKGFSHRKPALAPSEEAMHSGNVSVTSGAGASSSTTASYRSLPLPTELPLYNRVATPSVLNHSSAIYATNDSVDVATSFWVQNLRPSSNTPSKPGQQPVVSSSSATGSNSKRSSSSRQSTALHRSKTPTNSGTRPSSVSYLSPQTGGMHTSTATGSSGGGGAKYFQNYRPLTDPKPPQLKSDSTIARRQAERQQREEERQRQEKEDEKQQRLWREHMKKKALQTAQDVGTYRPSPRFSRYQRLFERYSGRSDIGIDVERVARGSYAEYSDKHCSASSPAVIIAPQHSYQPQQFQPQKPPPSPPRSFQSTGGSTDMNSVQHQQEKNMIIDLQREFDEYDDQSQQYQSFQFGDNRLDSGMFP